MEGEVGGRRGLGRNKVNDEAEIVETWERRMTEICTYMGIFGGAILMRVVCWLGEKRIFESACIALAFLGIASLRFSE